MANERARALRRSLTDAERKLWYALRRDATGVYFRRQHPIGSYVVDFVCLEHKLIIEADGGQHAEMRAEHDAVRTAWLEQRGYTVMRFWNNDILNNIEGVVEAICARLEEIGDA
ncbi:MAG: endonuclease domain-containing protein [Parvibaculum sp.]|nr:endonuclease domain-containing protein [Parvibaculum sp.]